VTKDVAKDMATMLEQVPVALSKWATKVTVLEGCRIVHKAGGDTKITLADAVVGTDSISRKSTVIRSPIPMTAEDEVYTTWEALLAKRYPNHKEAHRAVFIDTFKEAKQHVSASRKGKNEEAAATKLKAAAAKRSRDSEEAEVGAATGPVGVSTTAPAAAPEAAAIPSPARCWFGWLCEREKGLAQVIGIGHIIN